ncbi:mediator complex subunit MED14-domain-containing protein [Podospora appendiculata]|uniref:Mediator of RNA polymerase II transcription subunit 14 n=1 Tax=Podospora appendiculata TaxID=314037 RepID=A0AAE0XKM9_9PEZI|nr:mediator complex subunit MED14-domain-containing protein [Podospora appendiculata]
MENGTHNGVRTNHDRDAWMNGVNGASMKREFSPDKGKALANTGSSNTALTNGGDGYRIDLDSESKRSSSGAVASPGNSRINDLPDEIQHITTDILPLGLLLARLAQWTHARLQDEITTLAAKSIPPATAAVNGNSNYHFTGAEDTSAESLEKKTYLLNSIQDIHTRWVKALVITEWSKKADQVGRLIDIRSHLASQLELFNANFWELIKVKQDLHWARLPSPDLKTALEVLTSGEVSWMPDLGYLEPPPISNAERASWIDNINTMLSVRLSFDEYDRIPTPFRDYTIGSGRVTFTIKGEFEVDLTIGDEDFEKQFWFIDFKFLFTPAPAEISEPVRNFLEAKVNDALAADGLTGCYNYLHEFVLTQKIGELRRQAIELSKGRWIDTLKVERLNRAMAIQYWTNRPHSQNTKSWIIIGVHSSKGPDGLPDPKHPSHLSLRWFRDSKEVKDFDIPFDVDTISTESLLTTVIARHVEYLLTSMCDTLLSKPRFGLRQARLDMEISKDEPLNSSLTVQLFDDENTTLKVDPFTGSFTMFPQSPIILEWQRKLNASQNPAEEGPSSLEHLRCFYTMKDLNSRAKSIGWSVLRAPISADDLKSIVHSSAPSREAYQAVWLRRNDWNPQWFVMTSMSLGGDHWWLVELAGQKPGSPAGRLKMYTRMPMSSDQLSLSDEFFQNLAVYVTGMVSQLTDLRELHSKRMYHATREAANYSLPPQVKLPTIFVRLSEMLRSRTGSKESQVPWAREFIQISFMGIRHGAEDEALMLTSKPDATVPGARRDSRLKIVAEARISVTNKAKFRLLKGNVDHDVMFNPYLGQFCLRLRAYMGSPVVNLLSSRIQALERLVDFVEAIHRAGKNAVPESATLREVVFTYTSDPAPGSPQSPRPWRVHLDLTNDEAINVTLEKGNPHLRILDYLHRIANSSRFETLPQWLLFSLPLYRGLEKIEDDWEKLSLRNEGHIYVFHKAIDWMTIRFQIATPGSPTAPPRQVNLDIKPHIRRGKQLWHVFRSEVANRGNDEFDRVLTQLVWSTNSNGVKGLGNSAAADPEIGIEPLLTLVSDAVKSLVGTPPPPPPSQPAILARPPTAFMSGAEQQMVPTPPQALTQQQQQHQQQQQLHRFAQQQQQQQLQQGLPASVAAAQQQQRQTQAFAQAQAQAQAQAHANSGGGVGGVDQNPGQGQGQGQNQGYGRPGSGNNRNSALVVID